MDGLNASPYITKIKSMAAAKREIAKDMCTVMGLIMKADSIDTTVTSSNSHDQAQSSGLTGDERQKISTSTLASARHVRDTARANLQKQLQQAQSKITHHRAHVQEYASAPAPAPAPIIPNISSATPSIYSNQGMSVPSTSTVTPLPDHLTSVMLEPATKDTVIQFWNTDKVMVFWDMDFQPQLSLNIAANIKRYDVHGFTSLNNHTDIPEGVTVHFAAAAGSAILNNSLHIALSVGQMDYMIYNGLYLIMDKYHGDLLKPLIKRRIFISNI